MNHAPRPDKITLKRIYGDGPRWMVMVPNGFGWWHHTYHHHFADAVARVRSVLDQAALR